MKYDLLIIGGGPAGLMAARTAARDGLKVLLVEKNREVTRIKRYCSRNLRLGPGGFRTDKIPTDIEIRRNRFTFEVDKDHYLIRLSILPEDSAIDYHGTLGPCFNDTSISPSGQTFDDEKDSLGFHSFVIDKEALLADLLNEAVKAGCEVRAGTRCDEIEDSLKGARIKVTSSAGEETIEASRVILADGAFSPLVEKLGFNEGRPPGAPLLKFLALILDGINSPYPEPRHIRFCLPSRHKGFINLSPWPPGCFQLSCSTSIKSKVNLPDVLNQLMTDSPFSSWFAGSKVVEKQGCNMELRPQVTDTARGNIICIGDNVAYAETAMKGALPLGYTAAKSSQMALEDKDGNQNHNYFWQHSYNSFSPQYRAWGHAVVPISRVLSDAEVDTLYRWIGKNHIHGKINDILSDHRRQFEAELPQIADKVLAKEGGRPGGRPKA